MAPRYRLLPALPGQRIRRSALNMHNLEDESQVVLPEASGGNARMSGERCPAIGLGRATRTSPAGGPGVIRMIVLASGTLALSVMAGCTAAVPSSPAAVGRAAPIPYQVGAAAVSKGRARQLAASAADTSCDPTASLRPAGPPRVSSGSF